MKIAHQLDRRHDRHRHDQPHDEHIISPAQEATVAPLDDKRRHRGEQIHADDDAARDQEAVHESAHNVGLAKNILVVRPLPLRGQ
ncbi:hypothetical protein D3C73_1466250 [compost metagenome]